MRYRFRYYLQRLSWAYTRACWFLSRQIGGRSVFGKRDQTPRKRLVIRLEERR